MDFLNAQFFIGSLQSDRERACQLDQVLDHIGEAVIVTDLDGMVTYWNREATSLFGFSPEEAIGQPLCKLHAADPSEANEARPLERVGAGEQSSSTIDWRKSGGGSVRVAIKTKPLVDTQGRLIGEMTVARDVSQLLTAEEAMRQSEARFHSVLEQPLAGVYVIQAGKIVYANPRMRAIFGYGPDEPVDPDPLTHVKGSERAKVVEQMRRRLDGEHQAAYSVSALRKDGTEFTLGLHATLATYQGRPAIIAMAQDITEKARAEDEIKRHIAQIEKAMHSTIDVIMTMGELRDPYTQGHEHRVGKIAATVAAAMGMDVNRIEGIRIAGYLHDVGKVIIPAEILAKPTRLSSTEFELVKEHAQKSYEILKGLNFPWPVAEIAWQHHERLDGSGYPRGLQGDQIILEARVLAVADTVEAMASHRPYRPALGIDKALAEIENSRGKLFDPEAVDACLRLFREMGYQLPRPDVP